MTITRDRLGRFSSNGGSGSKKASTSTRKSQNPKAIPAFNTGRTLKQRMLKNVINSQTKIQNRALDSGGVKKFKAVSKAINKGRWK